MENKKDQVQKTAPVNITYAIPVGAIMKLDEKGFDAVCDQLRDALAKMRKEKKKVQDVVLVVQFPDNNIAYPFSLQKFKTFEFLLDQFCGTLSLLQNLLWLIQGKPPPSARKIVLATGNDIANINKSKV